jgi:hypothetical protein
MTANFERHDTSLQSKPAKKETCPSCEAVLNPHNGECRCSP